MRLLDGLLDLIFPRSAYGRRSVTRRGVEVRSGAERRIADHFDSLGLRYEYERELVAGFWIFKRKVSCPDFYLPDHDVYVEFWGMLNVADGYDRSQYERSMQYKLARYRDMGVKLVSLYPEDLKNLDGVFRERFKQVTGKEPVGK